jgi:DNA-binding MarR family transcriptional regulator
MLACVVLVALISGMSEAAQRGGGGQGGRGGFGFGGGFGGGMGAGLVQLAQNEAVAKAIEVLDDQKEKIGKLAESLRNQPREGGRPDFQNMSDEERQKAFADMRARMEKQTEEGNAKLAEILVEPQMKRLREISLQLRGTGALSDPKIAAALQLTDEQKKKLEDVGRENMEAMRGAFQPGGDPAGMREKMQEMRKQADAKTLAVLNDEQKKKFEEMKGEPFPNLDALRGGFGGRGAGGRGGRGGAGGAGPRT